MKEIIDLKWTVSRKEGGVWLFFFESYLDKYAREVYEKAVKDYPGEKFRLNRIEITKEVLETNCEEDTNGKETK